MKRWVIKSFRRRRSKKKFQSPKEPHSFELESNREGWTMTATWGKEGVHPRAARITYEKSGWWGSAVEKKTSREKEVLLYQDDSTSKNGNRARGK